MEGFRKIIHGLDFGFELMQVEREYFYTIGVENHAFEMHIDENGIWKNFALKMIMLNFQIFFRRGFIKFCPLYNQNYY